MASPIDFYYEFSSPYAYMGAHLIDAVAEKHGREVSWRPFMLGAVFKAEGTGPLLNYPMKGVYAKHDLVRSARLHGLPFTMPPRFPILTVNASRIVYWAGDRDPALRRTLSLAFFKAVFGEGRDISVMEELQAVCEAEGFNWRECEAVIRDPVWKQRLKDETDAAIGRKVFGAPFFIVDDEPFWGVDRLPQLDRWLETGGW